MTEHALHAQSRVQDEAADRRWDRALAWCGIAGPVMFTAGFLGQELVRMEEYSPIAEPVSALEAGPHGWLQQVNFVLFGVLTIAFALGLHRGIRPTPRGLAGPALLAVSGVGALLAAVFPLREDTAGVTYDPGGHGASGVTFFLSSAVGLVLLSRRLSTDSRWRGLAGYTLACGLAAVAGFVVLGGLAIPDGAPLHDWAGLAQRIVVLGVLFPCRVTLAVRLLRLSRG